MMYIQFGERKKGRFVKSEQMDLIEFDRFITDHCLDISKPQKYTFIEKLTGKKRRLEKYREIYNDAQKALQYSIIIHLYLLILDDEVGKKSKK